MKFITVNRTWQPRRFENPNLIPPNPIQPIHLNPAFIATIRPSTIGDHDINGLPLERNCTEIVLDNKASYTVIEPADRVLRMVEDAWFNASSTTR